MRIKIAYKLLIVNLTIILILVLAMQVISYFSNKKSFNNFVSDIESEMLDDIAEKIKSEYITNNSWNNFLQNPTLWRESIRDQVKNYNPFLKTPPPLGERNLYDRSPPKPMDKFFRTEQEQRPPPRFFNSEGPNEHVTEIYKRISLLDANKKTLIQASISDDVMLSKEITFNNRVIGWLTLNEKPFKNNPITDYYLAKQLEINYWVGSLGILIATLFSYFLSRHITAPITLLSHSAQKIAKRDFSSRIKINTNDEFRDLAHSVNNISKALSKYDAQQKQWLMDISHELRTPLTILNGELEALADGITPLNNQAIKSLQEEVTLIMRLVHDLHELTVIDKIAFECQKENIDIIHLVNHQLIKFTGQFSDNAINLINALPKLEIPVKGDHDRLCQVVQNILKNGLRYIDSPGHLTISAKVNNTEVHLAFDDSGPGVPEAALTKLFNRLYRTDDSRNRKTGGAGLGLAICKNIILAHSGKIFATLNNEGGLSIHIHLPINH